MTKRKPQTYRGITFTRPKPFEDYGGDIFAPTVKQIHNLIDMAYVLQNSPPPEFDMGDFGVVNTELFNLLPERIRGDVGYPGAVLDPQDLRNIQRTGHVCGTSCCAIGTAAYHGVGKTRGRDWATYSRETFGIHNDNIWSYLFDGGWTEIENTPEAAVARILKLVIEGPEAVETAWDEFYPKYGSDQREKAETRKTYEKYLGIKIEDK